MVGPCSDCSSAHRTDPLSPDMVACNICGSPDFTDVNGRKGVLCARCGSYERTRLMKMFIEALPLKRSARVLHLAPERGLSEWLRGRFQQYVPADYDLPRYSHIPGMRRIDLCQREYSLEGRFDLILHSHVIEHLPIDKVPRANANVRRIAADCGVPIVA